MSIYQSYDLYEIIGHGASCTVKRAVRKDTRQVFAAKLYESDFLSAKNEIELLVQLDHPNIVNIYEVFEEGDCIILILEYMQGGELYDSVGQKKYFTEGQVRQNMKILVDCIRYCHQMSVVHRDIKPENLLMTSSSPDGILKLADFGISKIMSDEMLTTNCGTPVYMAPQIWKGEAYSSKVDVWSVGVVMYYLLSGSHPFEGEAENIGEIIMSQDLSFADPVWNIITSGAIDLLKRLLQKDPSRRPTAQQVESHLWFTQIENYSTESDLEETEIVLTHSVHKIRRFNFKQKEKKSRRKLQSLQSVETDLSDARIEFLCFESSENEGDDLSLKHVKSDMTEQGEEEKI